MEAMESVWYSKAYDRNNHWYSEFVGSHRRELIDYRAMNCKRVFYILILIIGTYAEVSAQDFCARAYPIKGDEQIFFLEFQKNYEYEAMDSSRVRLFYNVDICLDSLDNDRLEKEYVKLIGDGYTKFQPQQRFLYDKAKVNQKLAVRYIDEYKEHHLFFNDAVIENLKDGAVTVTSRVAQDDLIYEEPTPQIEWTFTDETKQIDGYDCSLAECDFRGRHYYAWFTQDIPLPYGPWLFNGLPGLIISVYDKAEQYKFTFKSYDGNEEPILFCKYNYKKVSRKDMNKARTEILHKPMVYMYHHLSEKTGWYIEYERYAKYKDREYKYDTIELQ